MEMARLIGWVQWMIPLLPVVLSSRLLLIPSSSDVEIDRLLPTQTPIHLFSLVENLFVLSHGHSIGKHVKISFCSQSAILKTKINTHFLIELSDST
jgi:hypothetical protein